MAAEEPAALASVEPELEEPELFGEGPEAFSYVEDTGPGVPDAEEPEPELPTEPPGREQLPGPIGIAAELHDRPSWKQDAIADMLASLGSGAHQLFGVTENDWRMTQEDLNRIVPPLTRIANRYDVTARVAPYADPILVTKGLVIYTWRSALERQRAMRDEVLAPLTPEQERERAEIHRDAGPVQGNGQPAPKASANRMRSPVADAERSAEEELPGEPADYDQPGLFDR